MAIASRLVCLFACLLLLAHSLLGMHGHNSKVCCCGDKASDINRRINQKVGLFLSVIAKFFFKLFDDKFLFPPLPLLDGAHCKSKFAR
jgi:hypothetical protein